MRLRHIFFVLLSLAFCQCLQFPVSYPLDPWLLATISPVPQDSVPWVQFRGLDMRQLVEADLLSDIAVITGHPSDKVSVFSKTTDAPWSSTNASLIVLFKGPVPDGSSSRPLLPEDAASYTATLYSAVAYAYAVERKLQSGPAAPSAVALLGRFNTAFVSTFFNRWRYTSYKEYPWVYANPARSEVPIFFEGRGLRDSVAAASPPTSTPTPSSTPDPTPIPTQTVVASSGSNTTLWTTVALLMWFVVCVVVVVGVCLLFSNAKKERAAALRKRTALARAQADRDAGGSTRGPSPPGGDEEEDDQLSDLKDPPLGLDTLVDWGEVERGLRGLGGRPKGVIDAAATSSAGGWVGALEGLRSPVHSGEERGGGRGGFGSPRQRQLSAFEGDTIYCDPEGGGQVGGASKGQEGDGVAKGARRRPSVGSYVSSFVDTRPRPDAAVDASAQADSVMLDHKALAATQFVPVGGHLGGQSSWGATCAAATLRPPVPPSDDVTGVPAPLVGTHPAGRQVEARGPRSRTSRALAQVYAREQATPLASVDVAPAWEDIAAASAILDRIRAGGGEQFDRRGDPSAGWPESGSLRRSPHYPTSARLPASHSVSSAAAAAARVRTAPMLHPPPAGDGVRSNLSSAAGPSITASQLGMYVNLPPSHNLPLQFQPSNALPIPPSLPGGFSGGMVPRVQYRRAPSRASSVRSEQRETHSPTLSVPDSVKELGQRIPSWVSQTPSHPNGDGRGGSERVNTATGAAFGLPSPAKGATRLVFYDLDDNEEQRSREGDQDADLRKVSRGSERTHSGPPRVAVVDYPAKSSSGARVR